MNRRHTVPLAGLASVLALAACSTGTGAAEETADPFRIGVYAPMTGEMAEYGETFQRAFDLYLAQVEEAGGVEGHPIELEIRDDRGEPRQAANIAQELVDDPSIDATIGSFSSAASMAAAPIIERGGMPNISPTSSHPDYTAQGEYLFRNVNTQEIEGELNANFLYEQLGEDSAAVVHRQDDWGLSAAEAFTEGFTGLGGEVSYTEAVAPETRDFRSTVTTMSGQDVQALYLATFYSDAAVLAQQMASTGFDVPVLTNSSLFNPELVELGQEAVEGWYVATNFLPDDPAPEVTEFVSAYEEEYGTTPDQFAAIAYDTLAVLTTAMGQVVAEDGSIDKEELRDALREIEYTGASGTIDFDEQGDVRKEMTYLQIVDGEFVPVEG